MFNVVSIVEGHGEVNAVPLLIRRIAGTLKPPIYPKKIIHPVRWPVSKLKKPGEMEQAVEIAARKTGDSGRILVLLDSDDDCPAELGPDLLDRAQATRPDRVIRLALAKREFEAWFLAAAKSISGKAGLERNLCPPPDPESIRDAKGWLTSNMKRRYAETIDQEKLTANFDIIAARSCASFDKCYREIQALLSAP